MPRPEGVRRDTRRTKFAADRPRRILRGGNLAGNRVNFLGDSGKSKTLGIDSHDSRIAADRPWQAVRV